MPASEDYLDELYIAQNLERIIINFWGTEEKARVLHILIKTSIAELFPNSLISYFELCILQLLNHFIFS